MTRTFDRQKHMTEETLTAVQNILKQTWCIEQVTQYDENALYGLFDGYIYTETLMDLVLKLETVDPMLSVELSDVFATVLQYPHNSMRISVSNSVM